MRLTGLNILATLAVVFLLCSAVPRSPAHFVFDREHMLLDHERFRLDSLFRRHEKRTGNEIALVTTPTFNGRTASVFAHAFLDSAGVGKKRRNNGVVIVFSKEYREVFISTGWGTERVLHDSICKRIIDQQMIPRFKVDDHFGGLWAGSVAIVDFLDRPENSIP